jgi:hypothetical protein
LRGFLLPEKTKSLIYKLWHQYCKDEAVTVQIHRGWKVTVTPES